MIQMNQIVNMIRMGQNPQQVMMNLLQNMQTPISANLLNLAKQNRTADIEQVARNVMKQQGRDFDTEFQAFRKTYGL